MEAIILHDKERLKSICSYGECTSCMACYSVCPVHAISVCQDEQGFYKPLIDSEKCIGCRRCVQVCPVHGNINKNMPMKAIAMWIKDKKLHRDSTSGGAFTALAKEVIHQKGVVFGAVFDKNFAVHHSWVENENELVYMRGSKYVQSYVGNSFRKAREFLKAGRLVLFTGTPCQINGLKQFLKRPYPNLLTADIICHGTPASPVFRQYLNQMEEKYGSHVQSVQFRYKTDEWKEKGIACLYNMRIVFQSGDVYMKGPDDDPYLVGFFKNCMLNPACYHCFFTTPERIGDFTLADFWGYRAGSFKMVDTGKGVSLILINTERAKEIFNKISNDIDWIERPIAEAVAGNPHLSYPVSIPKEYDAFWRDYRQYGYAYVEKKYFYPIVHAAGDATFLRKIKNSIPPHLKYILKKILCRI